MGSTLQSMAELAAEILARTREVYATCRTYEDRGVVVTRMLHEGRTHTTRKTFSTAFARPDRFRFEWAEAAVGPEDEWNRMLVLWNEEGVRSSWTIQPGIRAHESVHAAIGCATGVSGGSAYTVPMLLLPGGGGRSPLPAPEDATLRGRERVEGRECFGLEHAPRQGRRQVLWIDCAGFLLRRIDEEQIFDESVLAGLRQRMEEDLRSATSEEQRKTMASAIEHFDRTPHRTFRTETVTSYAPILDAPLLPERFLAPPSWNPATETTAEPPSRAQRVFLAPSASAPSVAEILARVRRVYAGCKSYRDSGTTTTVDVDGPRRSKYTHIETFSIAFVRPDRLRFENAHPEVGPEEEWTRAILLSNEQGSIWWSMPGRTRHDGEPDSIARLGQAYVPLGLLVTGRTELDPLPSEATAALLGIEVREGCDCFVVKGSPPGREERTLWIGCQDSLVRRSEFTSVFDERWYREQRQRLEEELKRPMAEEMRRNMQRALEHHSRPQEPRRSETTITFAPVLDPAIPPETFATPPG